MFSTWSSEILASVISTVLFWARGLLYLSQNIFSIQNIFCRITGKNLAVFKCYYADRKICALKKETPNRIHNAKRCQMGNLLVCTYANTLLMSSLLTVNGRLTFFNLLRNCFKKAMTVKWSTKQILKGVYLFVFNATNCFIAWNCECLWNINKVVSQHPFLQKAQWKSLFSLPNVGVCVSGLYVYHLLSSGE